VRIEDKSKRNGSLSTYEKAFQNTSKLENMFLTLLVRHSK
jgi:hypothetical protein